MTVGQESFTEALLTPEHPVPDGLIDPAGRPAGKRFDVYRNNVAVSLTGALETAFPVIRKLVGDVFGVEAMDDAGGQFADAKGLTVGEQVIELVTVRRKGRLQVENRPEVRLHLPDSFADGKLAAKPRLEKRCG